jgi:hypothetical protein
MVDKYYTINITIIRQIIVTGFLLEITTIAHSEGIRNLKFLVLKGRRIEGFKDWLTDHCKYRSAISSKALRLGHF